MRIRQIAILALVIGATAFVLGYARGLYPQVFSKTQKVRIITQFPDLFSPAFLDYLRRRSVLEIEVRGITEDAHWNQAIWQADLLLGDSPTIGKAQEALGLGPLHRWFSRQSTDRVSADFVLSRFSANATLPLFWQVQDEELRILHLWVPPRAPGDPNAVARLIEQLLRKDLQLVWLQQMNWNSTLLEIDTVGLPMGRKSGGIRAFDLKSLTIQ